VLPWWAFLAIALYCYLVPFFRPLSLAPAFSIFIFMTLAAPVGLFWAIYAGATMALILGIKDFVIVNRKISYQLLMFLMSFAGCLLLFSKFSAWSVPASFLSLATLSFLWFWMLRSDPERRDSRALPSAIAAFMLFEVGAAMFFLPISFFAQAAMLFLASALLFEAATNLETLTFRHVILWAGSYSAISLLVVFLASWKV
jgi:hypothetical protein